jgi:hypothetical protein
MYVTAGSLGIPSSGVWVAHLIDRQLGAKAEAALYASIIQGQLEVADLGIAGWERIQDLVSTYADLRLGAIATIMCGLGCCSLLWKAAGADMAGSVSAGACGRGTRLG